MSPVAHGRIATREQDSCGRSGSGPRSFAWACRGLGPLQRCRACLGSGGQILRVILLVLLLGSQAATQCEAAELVGSEVAADDLLLELRPERTRAYLHEAVSVTVTLLAGAVSVRNIQYPRLDGAAFRTSEFSPPRRSSVARNGREYAAYEFSATLIPRASGEIDLGPAELRCELLNPGSGAAAFFGGSEPRSVTLRSQPVRLTLLPLPTRGRPAGYSGSVGRFSVTRQVSPTVIRQGDPVTVTTRIEGVGNIDSFPCESIALPGARAYPPRARRTVKRLTCEQVLLPEADASLEIPAASISFFDPLNERYSTLKSEPVHLNVVTVASTIAPPARASIAERADDAAATRQLLVTVAVSTLLLVALVFHTLRRKRTGKAEPAISHAMLPSVADWLAEAKDALAGNDSERFHTAAYRALQAHLGAKYGLAAGGITSEVVAKFLRPIGIQQDLLESYESLFLICDRARYAPGGIRHGAMADTHRLLERVMQRSAIR